MNKLLNNKSLLLFDLDETIYDHQYSSLSGLKAIAKQFPIWQNHSLELLENIYFKELHSIYLKVIDGHISDEEAHIIRLQKLAEQCQLQFSMAEYETMVQTYVNTSRKEKRPIPNAPETVLQLKNLGFTIAIITNGATDHQKQKIKLCGIDEHIDFALISEEIGIRKPSKDIFEKALELSNSKPEQALMVGDSWDSDILGAQAAKIQPIWVNRGRHQNLDPQNVVEISHINQLLSFK